jgi:peptidoglycan/LPS O-acetylase OafA/YrhL
MGIFRALLALGVLLEHAERSLFVDSYTAVETFFIISGFYMSLILRNQKYEIIGFYASRAVRLFPIFWVGGILTIVSSIIFIQFDIETTFFTYLLNHDLNTLELFWVAWINSTLIGADSVWFINHIFGNQHSHLVHLLTIPPSWTLSLEIYFYLLVPFLCFAKDRTLALLCLISIGTRVVCYFYYELNTNPFHARFFPFEIVFFSIGILCQRYELTLRNYFANSANIFILSLFLFSIFFHEISNFLDFPEVYKTKTYIPSLLFYSLTLVTLPSLFDKSKSNSIDKYLGEYSYPLYVFHYCFVAAFIHSGVANFWAVLIPTVLISALSIHFIQMPIDKFRHQKFVARGS